MVPQLIQAGNNINIPVHNNMIHFNPGQQHQYPPTYDPIIPTTHMISSETLGNIETSIPYSELTSSNLMSVGMFLDKIDTDLDKKLIEYIESRQEIPERKKELTEDEDKIKNIYDSINELKISEKINKIKELEDENAMLEKKIVSENEKFVKMKQSINFLNSLDKEITEENEKHNDTSLHVNGPWNVGTRNQDNEKIIKLNEDKLNEDKLNEKKQLDNIFFIQKEKIDKKIDDYKKQVLNNNEIIYNCKVFVDSFIHIFKIQKLEYLVCNICFNDKVESIFKCGHHCCNKCFATLNNKCHVCRNLISETVKLYY